MSKSKRKERLQKEQEMAELEDAMSRCRKELSNLESDSDYTNSSDEDSRDHPLETTRGSTERSKSEQGSSPPEVPDETPKPTRHQSANEHDEPQESEQVRKFNLIIGEELDQFLADPNHQPTTLLTLRQDVAERVKLILDAGLLQKNDRDKLLKEIPRDRDLQLEAPVLNQEIGLNLHKDEATRDNFFRQYQKIIGATISEAASLLNFFTEIAP
ncbi:hypothetical protein QAD02_009172 [Eretmocerus hayati]|uniref:Uncharacterized protein n=1 Tax=Eretmocerus hayati TaxID=131215 RepID=A0ACC2N8G8_9HYME|nr:hypothetical protein QAD02_009172 [Eretmocerus hayati]